MLAGILCNYWRSRCLFYHCSINRFFSAENLILFKNLVRAAIRGTKGQKTLIRRGLQVPLRSTGFLSKRPSSCRFNGLEISYSSWKLRSSQPLLLLGFLRFKLLVFALFYQAVLSNFQRSVFDLAVRAKNFMVERFRYVPFESTGFLPDYPIRNQMCIVERVSLQSGLNKGFSRNEVRVSSPVLSPSSIGFAMLGQVC